MFIDIPRPLLNEDLALSLVQRYLNESSGRPRYSGAYFDKLGGRGDRKDAVNQFTAEDLLAVTLLSVRIEGYHALEILCNRANELNGLLAEIPATIPLCAPKAKEHIRATGPAWRLWEAICDIEPRPEGNRIGPVAAGKLLARKRPELLPVYDSRIKKVLGRPRVDKRWWHDLHHELTANQGFVQELESVRPRVGADHMSLLRVFDVMCWMYSWEDGR